jgi:hypothetical protein
VCVSTKAFALIWRVAGSPLGTGSHGTTIDANTKNDTRSWNTCTPSRQHHPPSTRTRVGACDSTVPVCACGECGDEHDISGELKKEKRVNVARRYCCGCEVCCWAGSSICVCWRGWSMNEEPASISRVFVVGFSTFIAEAGAGTAKTFLGLPRFLFSGATPVPTATCVCVCTGTVTFFSFSFSFS